MVFIFQINLAPYHTEKLKKVYENFFLYAAIGPMFARFYFLTGTAENTMS